MKLSNLVKLAFILLKLTLIIHKFSFPFFYHLFIFFSFYLELLLLFIQAINYIVLLLPSTFKFLSEERVSVEPRSTHICSSQITITLVTYFTFHFYGFYGTRYHIECKMPQSCLHLDDICNLYRGVLSLATVRSTPYFINELLNLIVDAYTFPELVSHSHEIYQLPRNKPQRRINYHHFDQNFSLSSLRPVITSILCSPFQPSRVKSGSTVSSIEYLN